MIGKERYCGGSEASEQKHSEQHSSERKASGLQPLEQQTSEQKIPGLQTSEQQTSEQQNPFGVFYDNYLDTTACTECTGLMPKAARNREEWDAYREIFDFTPEQLPSGDRPGE